MSKTVSKRLTMPGQIHKAYKVMLKLINPRFVKADQQIPLRILKNAKGIAFVTVVKAGFVWSGTVGSGIVIAKLPDGTWSGPSSVGVAGMGWGALIGASVTDSVIILNTDLAVKAFAGHGQIKFGGSLSIAAGPLGREGDGSAYLGDGGVAACYSYSHSRGLFAGISLQGAIFMTRDSDNARFYGCPVKASEIMKGKVIPPEFEDLKKLWEVLSTINQTESYSDLKDKASFRDSSAVSLQGSGARGLKYDDDDDDDDLPRASMGSSSASGFAWGNDEDDEKLAKAIMATTIAEKSDDLEPGWVKVTSEGGQPYYWHEPSGKTQWDAPLRTPTAKFVPPPPPPPPAQKEDPDALAPGWVQVMAGDGKPYYWHEEKNITQWERPTKIAQASGTKQVPVRSASAAVSAPTAQAVARPQSSTSYNSLSTAGVSFNAQSGPRMLTTQSSGSNQGVAAAQAAALASSGTRMLTPQSSGSNQVASAVQVAALASSRQGYPVPTSTNSTPRTVPNTAPQVPATRPASFTNTRPPIPARPSAGQQPQANPFDSM